MSKLEKPHVLLVDDNEATCTLIRALLQREFAVEIASDGGEALEQLKTHRYSAILLDLRMPHVDGYAVLEFLKTEQPETLRRVLILTASLTDRELDRARAYDICGIIAKPFEVETLLAAVKQCAANDTRSMGGLLLSSTGVILLLADWLQQRWV